LVNCIVVYDGNNQHRLKIRWDVEAGEELFLEYGKEFWKENYWQAPAQVRNRYPEIVPTHPAPAEGEAHCLTSETCLTPDILKFPKNFVQARTRQWKAPKSKKRKATSECGKRVARIVC
jgi:hypothetical protein